EDDFGLAPVRLNADGEAEVVWARRIDPVRARLDNIPFPDSGFRYADLVLHDGAPVGYRTHAGREYPVFNVLELIAASDYGTYEPDVVARSPDDLNALDTLCGQAGVVMEDWSTSTRMLCKACSEGRPHEHHDVPPTDADWKAERRIALTARSAERVEAAL